MTIKTNYKISWLKEATFGSNTINANTQTYLFGQIEKEQILPAPVMEYNPFYGKSKRGWNEISKGKASFSGDLIYILQDGVMFYYALGDESFSDEGDYNTHDISGIDSGDLPSFTIHYEAHDRSGNAIVKDFLGCKISKLDFTGVLNLPVACKLTINAVNMQDGNEITSNYPVLPPTKNESLFVFRKATFKWNNSEFDITTFTLSIDNSITPKWVYRSSNEHLPKYLLEGNRMIGFAFSLYLEDFTLLDEILTATSRSLEITFTRSTHDFIKFTLSNSYLKSAPLKIPEIGNANEYLVMGLAKECSISVEDKVDEYSTIGD